MARLDKLSYPGNWQMENESCDNYINRVNKMFDAIPKERIVRFPIADGYALYFVSQWKPLVLQHIPMYDAYRIPDAHMRGLREQDVRTLINNRLSIMKLFKKG
jgi:hypothetical protein